MTIPSTMTGIQARGEQHERAGAWPAAHVRLGPVVLLVLGALATACAASEPEPGSAIEPAELVARIDAGTAPVILDVRTPEEFAAGHVPGAVNVPHTELAERLAELGLSADEEIVVHCERGGRAAAAESVLRDAGFVDVRDLSGHMQRWREGGHPLE